MEVSRAMKVVDVHPELDLEILFYPSFILPLFDVYGNKVKKLWGTCAGLVIDKEYKKIRVYHSDIKCLEYAEEVLGLWSTPTRMRLSVDRRYRDFVEKLIERYEWFGIATSSQDDVEVFSSIFLSRNTNFHTNVVKWIRRTLERYGCMKVLLHTDLRDISEYVGRSYQIYELVPALKSYMELRNCILSSNSIGYIKELLLRIRGAGLKVFNAYMLFVKKSTDFAPIDRNVIAFLKKFESTSSIVAEIPKKDLCMKCLCNSCTLRYRCTYYRFREAFKELSGWIQTIAYVHNKTSCSKALCSSCTLKSLCTERKA